MRKLLKKWFWKEHAFSVRIKHFFPESKFYIIEYIIPGCYFFLTPPKWNTLIGKRHYSEYKGILLSYSEAKEYAQQFKTFNDIEIYYKKEFGKITPEQEIII